MSNFLFVCLNQDIVRFVSIELLHLLGIDQEVKKHIQGHMTISGAPGLPVQAHTALKSTVRGVWMSMLCHVQLFATPWTIAHRAPLSGRLSRQEYCSGLALTSSGDPADPGIEPKSPVSPTLAGEFFTTEPPGKPQVHGPETQFHATSPSIISASLLASFLFLRSITFIPCQGLCTCSFVLLIHSPPGPGMNWSF